MKKTNPVKIFLIAIRPFALPASVMPVIFGTTLAVVIGNAAFNLQLFILALFAMVLLHSGANILSDVNDYRKGIDKEPTPVSGAIVRGLITPVTALMMSITLLTAGLALGVILFFHVGIPILIIGTAGILIGVFYTLNPLALKYHALGDLAVFLDFGTLGALGAWTVQTGSPSWIPVVWAIPMSMLVVAILHANNWRDIKSDNISSIKTVASLLKNKGSYIYYSFLTLGSFVVLIVLLILTNLVEYFKPAIPFTFIITMAALPFGIKLLKYARTGLTSKGDIRFVTLDASTSKLNLIFGSLCTVSLLLDEIIKKILI